MAADVVSGCQFLSQMRPPVVISLGTDCVFIDGNFQAKARLWCFFACAEKTSSSFPLYAGVTRWVFGCQYLLH